MWLFTKYGFFSAVCVREADGPSGDPIDATRITVRSRVRQHLEALQKRFPDLLGKNTILDYVGTDYAYRIFVPKQAWVHVASLLAEDVDYDNFKSEVAHNQGSTGAAYEHSLHSVWSVMNRLQK